jgi:hypothetical protein
MTGFCLLWYMLNGHFTSVDPNSVVTWPLQCWKPVLLECAIFCLHVAELDDAFVIKVYEACHKALLLIMLK